jgi:tetratricopeptide (TPR) repeat protein
LSDRVRAFTAQKYDLAAHFFEEAIRHDPDSEVARMYLATTYMSQFVTGSIDSKSKEMANKAIATFIDLLSSRKAPNKPDINNMLNIANLSYLLKQCDESKHWCRKILEIDPQNAEANNLIAVIDSDHSLRETESQGKNDLHRPFCLASPPLSPGNQLDRTCRNSRKAASAHKLMGTRWPSV